MLFVVDLAKALHAYGMPIGWRPSCRRWAVGASSLNVPGILLRVPGSLGFRSVTSFLDDNLLVALATALDVALVAIALVAGLPIANLALPPRKAL